MLFFLAELQLLYPLLYKSTENLLQSSLLLSSILLLGVFNALIFLGERYSCYFISGILAFILG